ncbi:MAG: hypothetical protein R2856_34805 [Caldilineaceae bacterium]
MKPTPPSKYGGLRPCQRYRDGVTAWQTEITRVLRRPRHPIRAGDHLAPLRRTALFAARGVLA